MRYSEFCGRIAAAARATMLSGLADRQRAQAWDFVERLMPFRQEVEVVPEEWCGQFGRLRYGGVEFGRLVRRSLSVKPAPLDADFEGACYGGLEVGEAVRRIKEDAIRARIAAIEEEARELERKLAAAKAEIQALKGEYSDASQHGASSSGGHPPQHEPPCRKKGRAGHGVPLFFWPGTGRAQMAAAWRGR